MRRPNVTQISDPRAVCRSVIRARARPWAPHSGCRHICGRQPVCAQSACCRWRAWKLAPRSWAATPPRALAHQQGCALLGAALTHLHHGQACEGRKRARARFGHSPQRSARGGKSCRRRLVCGTRSNDHPHSPANRQRIAVLIILWRRSARLNVRYTEQSEGRDTTTTMHLRVGTGCQLKPATTTFPRERLTAQEMRPTWPHNLACARAFKHRIHGWHELL